jgi:hypothetical protein
MTDNYEYTEYRCGRCNAKCADIETKRVHEKFCEVPFKESDNSFIATRSRQ